MPSDKSNTGARVRDAIAWRLHKLLGDRVVYGSLVALAAGWRGILTKPVYFGVTGSAGKTTTKELLLGMLATTGRSVGNHSSFSNIEEIAKAMLKLRPTHRFFVTELSGHQPNEMDRPLKLLQPSIGIVTVIGDDHTSADYPREAIAREKSKLIAALPPTGAAVLNADDALVASMATVCRARVITYGVSAGAELRAESIRSVWPDRLQMVLVWGTQRVPLQTQLCGTHWVAAVLGAVGGGLAAGMTLAECAKGIASVAPFEGRMQPVASRDGVTFIRDDWKAPLWTVDACFDFMRDAQARRRIVVLGELSDAGYSKSTAYAKVATQAQEWADITILVGAWASSALKARSLNGAGIFRAFSHVRDASDFVNASARSGDLVLLKGTNRQDHLLRIILARDGDVACWRDDCRRYVFCNECPDRRKHSGATSFLTQMGEQGDATASGSAQPTIASDEQVIVGLGNPDGKYAGSPHNIGWEVVDLLAHTWGFAWTETPDAWIARGSQQGQKVCLVKVRLAMNGIGAGLRRIAGDTPFAPQQSILVHDDLSLPLGTVRTRLNGGAGGHRGVASILEAFQTDAFKRVKLGIGQPNARDKQVEYVLSRWDIASRPAVDASIHAAVLRIDELLASRPKAL
ncbi:aminoacyl-tRNA hydrolase [Rhodoferax sp.]|uniref:aminoacyl-tRNA hydrolase n=1 Tax=Rhodoferax sp. TaxID=50421 RepID=UPI0027506225|nr:aminoacyl-tRNA hydrolase [Rhodoferax sp.]